MPDYHSSTQAIVLRKRKLTETSLVVSLLTRDYGRISVVAKGARKTKGGLSGQIDLFYLCEVSFRRSRNSDLHTLIDVSLIDPHPAIREHYIRLLFASYASEWIELATEPEHSSPELFHLLQRLLGYLSRQNPDRRALSFFEMEICRASGIEPGNETQASRELIRYFHKLPDSRSELTAALK